MKLCVVVPERLRGCTRNALGSARVSSSLTAVAFTYSFRGQKLCPGHPLGPFFDEDSDFQLHFDSFCHPDDRFEAAFQA